MESTRFDVHLVIFTRGLTFRTRAKAKPRVIPMPWIWLW